MANIVSTSRKQPRVFVVDDNDLIASSLAMILRHQGFDARSFSKPFEALQAARFEAPDLLISDVMMPRLSGIELAIQVQQRSPDCRILLLSSHAAAVRLLKNARARGHNFELLPRPVHPTDLLKKIQTAFESSV